MSVFVQVKYWTFSAITALSPMKPYPNGFPGQEVAPYSSGNLGTVLGAIQGFVADLGVSESVKRQLIGIEQIINKGLVDLSPYDARANIKLMSHRSIEANADCSIYDAGPSPEQVRRSGVLVFVRYYADAFGVVRDPGVELIGFGRDMQTAWNEARQRPSITSTGVGRFQAEKSYLLWYHFDNGKIVSSKVQYPFYLLVVGR